MNTPYMGPHVILSRSEIERLHEIMVNHFLGSSPPPEDIDKAIQQKLDAALKSNPDFLKPAT